MNQSLSSLPSTLVGVERYEQLRRYFLEGAGTLVDGALALQRLLTQGVAGWMSAWTQVAGAAAATCRQSEPVTPPLPSWQRELTSLLAQMSLPHFQTTRL